MEYNQNPDAIRQQMFDLQNQNITYPSSAKIPTIDLTKWEKWLAEFKAKLIAAHGWTEEEAKLNILNGWACVRDGRLIVLSRDDHINTHCGRGRVVALSGDDVPPVESVPVFLTVWPETKSWKMPEQIFLRLDRLIVADLAPRIGPGIASVLPGQANRVIDPRKLRPYPTLLRLLARSEQIDGAEESPEIKQIRAIAVFWESQLIEAWFDEELYDVHSDPDTADALHLALLCAFETGRRHAILERCRKQPLTERLEASWLGLHVKLGRTPTTEETARAAGGVYSDGDGDWHFDGLDRAASLTRCEIDDRLEAIRYKHYALTDPVIRAGGR